MKNLINFHFKTIFSATTKLIIIISLLISLITNIILSLTSDKYLDLEIYLYSSLTINKIIFILTIIVIFSNAILAKNDNLSVLVINWLKNRFIFIISKIIVLFFILLGLFLVLMFFQNIIALRFSSYYLSTYLWLEWFNILFGGMVFGLYSFLFTQIWNNQSIIIVPIVLFTVSQNLEFDNFYSYIISFLFINKEINNFLEILLIITYIIFLFCLNIIYYFYKDLIYL